MDVPEKVRNMIAEALELDGEIKNEHRMVNDLGADSLDFIDLVMDFENAFDIEIPETEWEKVQNGTVGDVICVVQDAIARD